MTTKWIIRRNRDIIRTRCRRLNFRSTNELIARRQRLRKRIAAAVALCLACGTLLLGLE